MFKTPLTLLALAATTACTPFWIKRDDPPGRAWFSPSVAALEEETAHPGAEIYAVNCAYCHGDMGRGDGQFAEDLPVAPVDLTQLARAQDGLFPAERVMATIHGDPGIFHRGTMPEFSKQFAGPVVEWRSPEGSLIMTPKGLLDIVAYVESLQAREDPIAPVDPEVSPTEG